jgi:hypothetical protein
VDGSGSAYITGLTQSPTTFPRVGTNTSHAGDSDVIVVKLGTVTPNLQIIYSTFLGGSGNDTGSGIAVDSSGSAYVTGFAYSSNFPVVGTTTGKNNGTSDPDAFVTKLGTSGANIVYSTYIGGSAFDQGYGIAVDSAGSAYITGEARSINFPIVGTTTGKSDNNTTASDVYFVRLGTETPITLVYSTCIGGSGTVDIGRGIALDSSGYAYITGETASSNFPRVGTTTAYGGGSYDVFVTKLDSTPSSSGSSDSSGGGGDGGSPPREKLTVNSTNPSSGATGVSVITKVYATFSMYVNGTTVTTDSFKLSSESGGVGGYVTTNGNEIIFIPSEILSYGAVYTARVTTKIRAANWAGTTMDSDYTWNFTTENTYAVTPISTPTLTLTPIPEASPTPSSTPFSSPTLEVTPFPTVTPMPMPTPSPTLIPTPTSTPVSSPTHVPTPFSTPSPVVSPTPVPGLGSILGYVYDSKGKALNDATVTVEGDEFSDNTETNEEGYYVFEELPADTYKLVAVKKGYQKCNWEIVLEAGEEKEIEIRMKVEDEDWTVNPMNGHAYRIVEGNTWSRCKKAAGKYGAYLVTVSDKEEQKWLVKTFGGNMWYWIGLTRKGEEKGWKWSNGEEVNYTNWSNGEPNNFKECEEYVIMNWRSGGKWNDVGSCTNGKDVKKAIIERDEVLSE